MIAFVFGAAATTTFAPSAAKGVRFLADAAACAGNDRDASV